MTIVIDRYDHSHNRGEMMVRKEQIPRLVRGEIEILEMLWREGSVTISQAHRALDLPIGYTTVQTRLNRLVKKNVLSKSTDRPALYSAAVTREDVSRHDLDLLVQRVNGGQVVPLVAHLVQNRQLTADEVHELKQMLAEAEKRSKANKPGRRRNNG
jgi:predicted transcriptional regulator